ncbi:MAG: glycosyltransferase family 4 protein [Akkermansiaceae bacterium]
MRILIVAYACEPGKGSEQGTGWNLAVQLAASHEVTVVTRANNQEVIEQVLTGRDDLKLSFIYHDLSEQMLRLKKRSFFPVQLYYALWLKSVSSMMREGNRMGGFDVVHHLTFNSFEIPPLFLGETSARKLWGPIGGGQIAPESLTSTLGRIARWKEKMRGWRVLRSAKNGKIQEVLRKCDSVLFANEETRDLLGQYCTGRTDVMVDVGVDSDQFEPSVEAGEGNRVLFAGKFEHRKGSRLLLKAFWEAVKKNSKLSLRMVGDGPEWEMEKAWVREHGLDEVIELPGRRTHAEMAQEFADADIFVFPSLRDTTGAIALEAMASEVPTVCLDHQGARLMVDEKSGIRVTVESEEETIKGMAEAIVRLSDDAEMRSEMGKRSRERVKELFSWESKVERLLEEYQAITEKPEKVD